MRRRGFVQAAILALLDERSMHGYQVMKELEERAGGAYTASAGTIYPALQELMEQSLVKLEEGADKKVYSLNEKGRQRLKEKMEQAEGDFWTEWKERMVWQKSGESALLSQAMEEWKRELHKAVKQARTNKDQAQELTDLLEEMTRRLKAFSTKAGNADE